MKKNSLILIAGVASASLASIELHAAIDIGMRTQIAMSSLSSLQSEDDFIYVNMSEKDSLARLGSSEKITTSWLKKMVFEYGKNVLLDYTEFELEDIDGRSILRDTFGISLNSKWVIISQHKGVLMLTPITPDEIDTSALQKALTPYSLSSIEDDAGILNSSKAVKSNALTLPHVAFYIKAITSINKEDCTFPQAARKSNYPVHLCSENANISLIYRVTLARSLKYGALGSDTPDSKIVRISLDDSANGSGIFLNDNFTGRESWRNPAGIVTGFRRMFVTDAIAQNYTINVKASNEKAYILAAFPVNKNPNYEGKEIKTFEFGITGGGEVSEGGPKAKLEASAKFTDQRWLTFNTQEYRISRSTPSFREINFKWEREQYATANSLLTWHSGPTWKVNNPVNHSRMSPISYRNFVPAMDTIYRASPTEVGHTIFNLGASVTLRPIYTGIYQYYYGFGHNETEGFEMPERWKLVKNTVAFEVDWDHPVFTGGRTVNLQVGAVNSRCVSVDSNQKVYLDKCSEFSKEQSFIYDHYGRYVSVKNSGLCFDGDSLHELQKCNLNLSQRWAWIAKSDNLTNELSGETLGYSSSSNSLQLYPNQSDSISLRMLSNFTDVYFHGGSLPNLAGYDEGESIKLNIQSSHLYLRSGWIIDAIGTEPGNLFGGYGGNLHSVDLSKVKKMTVYHGTFGGENRILNINFVMKDGSTMEFGRKPTSTDIKGVNTFEFGNGIPPDVIVWKKNGCLSGFRFGVAH